MAKRIDRVAPPPEKGGWDIRFANNQAAREWDELANAASANTRRAWNDITSDPTAQTCGRWGINDIVRTPKRPPGQARGRAKTEPLGQRWTVERTNSWLSNYGQLRRNTDRKPDSRHAALRLAVTIIITAKLIDWNNRYNPT